MNTGKLNKVTIRAFVDKKLSRKPVEFTFPINPEKYTRNLKVKNDESQAQGTRGTSTRMNKIEPEQLQLEFVFDNTGTVEGNVLNGVEVTDQIQRLLNVAYNIEGKIHEPRRLTLTWGDVNFDCKLSDLAINYTLFKNTGQPLRAKLNATFREYIEDELRVRRQNNQSPDLTHVRIAGPEDSLHLMTFDIYGTNKYYLQVARANGLTSPRQLPVGREIVFPPLEKNQ